MLWSMAGATTQTAGRGTTVAGVSLHGVCKSYGEVAVVHGVDLEVADHEFVVFVGPSGCGKSTLLRMIAGLEDITSGKIAIDGRVVNELDPKDRDVAMVFQDYALYPHMTVFENMAFSLRYRGVAKSEIHRRVDHAARILDIDLLAARMPRQLSGGQRQRVAIARALVNRPSIILADEPTGNLDSKTGNEIMALLDKLHAQGNTIFVVTHEHDIALHAWRVVHIRDGKVERDEQIR